MCLIRLENASLVDNKDIFLREEGMLPLNELGSKVSVSAPRGEEWMIILFQKCVRAVVVGCLPDFIITV